MENIIDLFICLLFKPYSSGVYSDWSTSLSLGWNSVILQQHSCLVTVKENFFFLSGDTIFKVCGTFHWCFSLHLL